MTTTTRVPTVFGPDTRFVVNPAPPVPFRAVLEDEFERLTARLLRERLAAFPDPEIALGDYEFAAELCNECLRQGVQASHTDFLIAAVAVNRKWAVFSHDRDFEHIAKVVPVRIHQFR